MGGSAMASVVGGVLWVLVVALAIWVVAAHHRLVRLRNQADVSWARIDVQLKRRYDLIPHLADAVHGQVAHERGTLDAVLAARGHAMGLARGAGPAARGAAESVLTQALGRLIAVAEADPELNVDPTFVALRAGLTDIEGRIGYARKLLTNEVRSYNSAVRTLPTNLIAGLGRFRVREFFQAAGDEPGPVQVRL